MRHAKRDHVGTYAAQADDHCTFTDADELTNCDASAKDNMVTDRHVPAENRIVGKNNVISDLAVVPDMRAHHEKTPAANFSNATIVLSASAHGYVFADVTFGTDDQTGRPSTVSKRLRRRPKRRKRVNDRSWPDCGVTGQIDVSNEAATVANTDVCADRTVRTDQDIFSDRRPGFDPRRGIDHMRAHTSDSMAPTWASATIWPATFASPRYHHIDLRRVMRSM